MVIGMVDKRSFSWVQVFDQCSFGIEFLMMDALFMFDFVENTGFTFSAIGLAEEFIPFHDGFVASKGSKGNRFD